MIETKNINPAVLRLAAAAALLVVGACAQNSVTGSLNTANLTARQPHAAPIAPTLARPGQTRVALLAGPAPNAETRSLTEEMAKMLALNGFYMVAAPTQVSPGEDLYFVVPEFAMKPGENGRNTVEISWLVANSNGDPLGRVAQRRQLDGDTGGTGWDRLASLGAAAAAEGVSQIIREQRDL